MSIIGWRARRKICWRTVLLRVGIAAVGVFVTLFTTYAVVVNALLLTGVGKAALNRAAPTHVQFEWRTAYSPWFLRVRTTGFVMRGEDSTVQWIVTTERANASFGAFDFFARRVRLHDAWARGVTTAIRFKSGPVAPPITDAEYRLWSIQIDDLTGDDVREVSVDTIRVTGGGHVHGGFYLKPLRKLSVPKTTCVVWNTTVVDGSDTLTTKLEGAFEVQIAELDLREVHGTGMLEYVDAKTTGRSVIGDLKFIDKWVGPELAVAGGAGPTEFDVTVQHGAIVPGSTANLRSEGFRLTRGHDALSGTAVLTASVPQAKPHIAVAVQTYGLGVHRDKVDVAHAPLVTLLAQVDNLDMTKPYDRWSVSIDVPSATASNLEGLNGYLDTPMLYGGSARLTGHATVSPLAASGHADVEVWSAAMQIGQNVVTASGTGEATLHDLDLRSWRGDLAGARISLRDVSGAGQHGWWADLSASPLSMAFKHRLSLSGAVTGKCKDAQLPLAMLGVPSIVRAMFGAQGFTGSGHVRLSQRLTELTDLRLIGNTIEVRAHYHGGSGAALVETPMVNVGIDIRNDESTTHLFVTRDWYSHTLSGGPRAERRHNSP